MKKAPENDGIIGISRPILALRDCISEVAPSDATVLILGESGVGKELVAKAIHKQSQRRNGPFIAANCITYAESMLESELFGHERGAFTGAVQKKPGRFERANGGTLFLDEIGELTPAIQAKLLRVLQEREFERVGGTETIKLDVRIIAATNRDLEAEVANGWFRQDLFYRLNVININVPPLKNRKEDISLLIDYFVLKFSETEKSKTHRMTDRCIAALREYNYPGNVRELKNIIHRAVILSHKDCIDVVDLPTAVRSQSAGIINGLEVDGVDTGALSRALQKAVVRTNNGRLAPWHRRLRCTRIDVIRDFLASQGRTWFSRNQFARFLETRTEDQRSKYKTAGVFIANLRTNGICVHNGKKANRSAYRLDRRFLSPPEAEDKAYREPTHGRSDLDLRPGGESDRRHRSRYHQDAAL